MRIISDSEAIRLILQRKNRYLSYLGAGASAEAGVPTAGQICDEISEELLLSRGLTDEAERARWKQASLNWDAAAMRYASCMHAYGNPTKRVHYFREKLKGKTPSFCHHGLALLMARGYLKNTGLTTNFDKLLESAFTRQALKECQPIRTEDELNYWEPDQERCYVVKLHGDYDTNNILNTSDEVILINEKMRTMVRDLAKDAGMLVLGTAGYEKSIHTLFDYLTAPGESNYKILTHGLLWGVYLPGPRPAQLKQGAAEKLVREQLHVGNVSPDIAAMMRRMSTRNDDFCFFPVWGAGNFIFDLVKATQDRRLNGSAELYLDHEMRLRHVFARAGLSGKAIDKHISTLRAEQRKLSQKSGVPAAPFETVFRARAKRRPLEVRLSYGDVTSRAWMADPEFQSVTRAVVSPEDTCVSAGGGVAYLLLEKAGRQYILNELAKFAPIPHDTVAVTSGGDLPVHYIFHAAAVEVGADASYAITRQDVRQTMTAVLERAKALGVGALWVPLMGAGVGALGPKQSLEGILESLAAWAPDAHALTVMIAVYRESVLERHVARRCLGNKLSANFSIMPAEARSRPTRPKRRAAGVSKARRSGAAGRRPSRGGPR